MSNLRSRVSKLNSGSGGGVSRKSSKATPTYKQPEVFWSNWTTVPLFSASPKNGNGTTFTTNGNTLYVTPKVGLTEFIAADPNDVEFPVYPEGFVDASGCLNLKILNVGGNSITGINVVGLSELETLECNNNYLTGVNIQGLSSLNYFNSTFNFLTTASVDKILSDLVTLNVSGGFVDISGTGNSTPSLTGLTYIPTLTSRGWDVSTN